MTTAILSYLAMGVVAALIFGLVRRDYRKATKTDQQAANVRFWDDIQEWMEETPQRENPRARANVTLGDETQPSNLAH